MIIRPAQLCQISSIALSSGKNFMPEQIFYYFKGVYGKKFKNGGVINDVAMLQYALWEYELARLKFESFVKGVGEKNGFISKWRVFLKDMDNELPVSTRFSVRDFRILLEVWLKIPRTSRSTNLLFSSGDNGNRNQFNYKIRNPSTFVLLLNTVLLQPQFTEQFKLDLFYRFFETHRSLNYDDTFTILFKLFKGDGYQLTRLADLARDQNGNNNNGEGYSDLPALAKRHLLEGLKGTKFERSFIE